MNRICIFGAGAIGGYLGARLSRTEAQVSLVARGPHLQAIRENGLTLIEGDQTDVCKVTATDNPADLGPQDFVIVTLKAHSLPAVVSSMQPLLGKDTAVVFAVNGVPWWYFYKLGGRFDDVRIDTVDPQGTIWDGIGPQRAIGCVVYPAAETTAPGIIQHRSGNRFSLGEPDGTRSERIATLAGLMQSAGFKAPIRPRIRDEIWIKLWGNASFNPISALTGATLEEIVGDAGTRRLVTQIMVELQAVGEALGSRFSVDIDKRIEAAKAVGAHKTSMLQDLESGRPMEIDALVAAVSELGRLVECPTPSLDIVLSLVRQRARLAGCN